MVGRRVHLPASAMAKAMKDAGIVWDATSLDGFLELPQKAVPGNRMPYAGLKDAADRADVIAYLSIVEIATRCSGNYRRVAIRWV